MKVGFIGKTEMFELFQSEAVELGIEMIAVEPYSQQLPQDMKYCIIRATSHHKEQIRSLVERNWHVDFLDNLERFHDDVGKIETSLMRENDGTGAFNHPLVDIEYSYGWVTPIVAKPIDGRFARQINYLYSRNDFLRFKEKINNSEDYQLSDFMFQEKLDLVDEFRALRLVINGQTKTFVTRRRTVCGKRNPNIRQRTLLPTGKINRYLDEHRAWKTGIVGYDIGRLPNGEFRIIEENRSPRFERTERRLRSVDSIPYEILKMMI